MHLSSFIVAACVVVLVVLFAEKSSTTNTSLATMRSAVKKHSLAIAGTLVLILLVGTLAQGYKDYRGAINKHNGTAIYMMDPNTKKIAKHEEGSRKGEKITTLECLPGVGNTKVPEDFDFATSGTCSTKDGTTRLVPYKPPLSNFFWKMEKLGKADKTASADTAEKMSDFKEWWQGLGWQQYLVFLATFLLFYLTLPKLPLKKVAAFFFVLSTGIVMSANMGTAWSNRPRPLLASCYETAPASDRPIPLGGVYLDFCSNEKLLLTTRNGVFPRVEFDPRFARKYAKELEGMTPQDFLCVGPPCATPTGVHDKVWVEAKTMRLEPWLSRHGLDRIQIVIYPQQTL